MPTGHSITALLPGVKRANPKAVQALFDRLYNRIARISLKKLGGPRRRFDEDDVANSAFREFLGRAAAGDFKKLENREDVWQLLTLIVGDKVSERLQHEGRKKRGGSRPEVSLEEVEEALSDDPSLEAEVRDAKEFLLANLPRDEHRRVFELLEEGRTHEEIAKLLNLSVRTVDRRIEDIRVAARQIGIGATHK